MQFDRCGCDAPALERIPRRWWMRLFKTRRLYRCTHCGAEVLTAQLPMAEQSVQAQDFWNSTLRPVPAEQLQQDHRKR